MGASDPVAVVGGGLPGLVAALVLSEKPGARVCVVESGKSVGGLYASMDYGANGRFDYGVHYLRETKVPQLDALLLGLLPRDEWEWNEGVRRDISGSYVLGRLQKNSPFIDLRGLS